MVLGAFALALASDNIEWDVYETLRLDATPVDVAISPDGRKIFVLTEKGEVLIFSTSTQPEARLEVGKHIDQIKSGPRGDTLILTSSKKRTVQVIGIDYIQTINTSGSPFKGKADARVVIAVFDDFQ
jgi:DNA-binding beta-propeller fold protein YncE